MEEYVIGVDIGGTKSHLALFNKNGDFVDLCHWGPLNHEVLPASFAQFEDEFGRFVNEVILKHRIKMEQIKFSVLGVAGVDTKMQHKIISGILEKIGLKKFILTNDAYLGIPAGNRSGQGTGICAINGTGCTLAGINREGKTLQIGGVGAISADKGGGNYLGGRLLSSVYTELFRKGEATLMTELLFKKYKIPNKYEYVEIIQEKSAAGEFSVSACNPLVFEAAGQGDKVAENILKEMADSYAGGILCMIEELAFPQKDELYIVFAGSVFVRGEHPLLIDTLKTIVNKSSPNQNINYIKLDVPNVAGAVIWALNSLHEGSNFYDKVCTQFRKLT